MPDQESSKDRGKYGECDQPHRHRWDGWRGVSPNTGRAPAPPRTGSGSVDLGASRPLLVSVSGGARTSPSAGRAPAPPRAGSGSVDLGPSRPLLVSVSGAPRTPRRAGPASSGSTA